jgi:FkbM family methyltransferase
MYDGSYERNEQDFIRLTVRSGMHVVDVGAHVGFHTRLLADLVGATGSVIAFEPVTEHVRALCDSIARAGCERRVRIVEAAVADRPGSRTMVVAAAEQGTANAYLEPVEDDGDFARSRRAVGAASDTVERLVPVVTLDESIADRPVGFMKIDAEGAEALVLRGAQRLLVDDHPILLVDLHPRLMARLDGTTPEALIGTLHDIGYECRLLGAGIPGPSISDVYGAGVTTVIFQPCQSTFPASPRSPRAIQV